MTSSGAHVRSLAPGQHSSDEKSQCGGPLPTLSVLTWPAIEPQTFCIDCGVVTSDCANWPVVGLNKPQKSKKLFLE